MIGVFVSAACLLFYLFFESSLVPMFSYRRWAASTNQAR